MVYIMSYVIIRLWETKLWIMAWDYYVLDVLTPALEPFSRGLAFTLYLYSMEELYLSLDKCRYILIIINNWLFYFSTTVDINHCNNLFKFFLIKPFSKCIFSNFLVYLLLIIFYELLLINYFRFLLSLSATKLTQSVASSEFMSLLSDSPGSLGIANISRLKTPRKLDRSSNSCPICFANPEINNTLFRELKAPLIRTETR